MVAPAQVFIYIHIYIYIYIESMSSGLAGRIDIA